MFELTTWPRNAWSIFDELESLQDGMNRMLAGQEGDSGWTQTRLSYPLMNVWSSKDGLIIDAELAGVDPKDMDISVMGDVLTLRGRVNVQELPKNETYHRRERATGGFERTLQLPFRADTAAVKANYKNGILRLSIPRSEEEKPRKISIEAA